MNAKIKKFGKFMGAGIIGVGAALLTNYSTHNYIDEQLYRYTDRTYFQPVENYRLKLVLDYVEKHSSLHEMYVLSPMGYKATLNNLKDKEYFEKHMEALKEHVAEFQAEYDSTIEKKSTLSKNSSIKMR
jgi:hypothetical protein